MIAETLPPQAEPDTLLVLRSRKGAVETIELSSDWGLLEALPAAAPRASFFVRAARLVRSLCRM